MLRPAPPVKTHWLGLCSGMCERSGQPASGGWFRINEQGLVREFRSLRKFEHNEKMTEPSQKSSAELSLRGLILGVLITLIFTAANVYLGLKVGLTFASSIPAAVISMAVLSMFRGATILENNIVQTVASAAGTLSAIIFVLPGLVIVGWWNGFPFWTSFAVCAAGGILGVLYTIPLRRALVTTSDLPYPEGVAAAEVLKVGSDVRGGAAGEKNSEAREGLIAVIYGAVASAGLAALSATRIAAGEVQSYFRIWGQAVTGIDFAFSLALVGVGHLVGLSVGLAMLLGYAIAWLGAVPLLSAAHPAAGMGAAQHALAIWTHDVRFIGAGAIAVAAVWSLAALARPVMHGLIATIATARARAGAALDVRDADLSGKWIVGLALICMLVSGVLLARFLSGTGLRVNTAALIGVAIPFIFLGGFLVAAVCGYMAGLIGASNSPISGVGILAIAICAGLMVAVVHPTGASRDALVAYSLFTTAIVFGVATISNDNLQDLKTGQLVGAAPWRQQVALIVGVLAGAAVIPPVLNLLAHAYGFAGAPHTATVTAQPLPAPQALLISALARGVIRHDLDWNMIGTGAVVGILIVAIDEFLGARKLLRLPPLAVGIGIYLPMSVTLPVVAGEVIGYYYNRFARRTRAPAHAERLGVLVASGLVVGESLFGVLLAGLIVLLGRDAPLALVGAHFGAAMPVGLIAFGGLIFVLYRWMARRVA